jgi:hypothetical protein
VGEEKRTSKTLGENSKSNKEIVPQNEKSRVA